MIKKRILFILKYRDNYGSVEQTAFTGFRDPLSSGLKNSVGFVSNMLNDNGFDSKVVHVIDSNAIDREVRAFNPQVVIIEALWVPPYKFDQLKPLHPDVHWIVRNHSELPFLSGEGIAIDWIIEYIKRGVEINSNTKRVALDLAVAARASGTNKYRISFLPNYYPHGNPVKPGETPFGNIVDIGCFGAIRPLKNQLLQAIASLDFAEKIKCRLCFHINYPRVEFAGERILRNLRGLFAHTVNAELVEHKWLLHDEFINLIKQMDINLQVSLSETFNIVTADAVNNNIPVVVSPEVAWLPVDCQADPTSSFSVTSRMVEIWRMSPSARRKRLELQHKGLSQYCGVSQKMWISYLNSI
jgi:hypothetical protein